MKIEKRKLRKDECNMQDFWGTILMTNLHNMNKKAEAVHDEGIKIILKNNRKLPKF
jgi:hypothetical protein